MIMSSISTPAVRPWNFRSQVMGTYAAQTRWKAPQQRRTRGEWLGWDLCLKPNACSCPLLQSSQVHIWLFLPFSSLDVWFADITKGRLESQIWMNFWREKTSKWPLTPPPRPRLGKLCCAFFRKSKHSATIFWDRERPPHPLFSRYSLFFS